MMNESYGIASEKKAGWAKLMSVLEACFGEVCVCSLIKLGQDVYNHVFSSDQKHVVKLFVCKTDLFLKFFRIADPV